MPLAPAPAPAKTPDVRPHRALRRRQAQGFTLVEMLIGLALLAVALLGNVSSSLTAGRLGTMTRARSEGLRHVEQFLERLRADEEWPTLYERLDTLQMDANTQPSPGAEPDEGEADAEETHEASGAAYSPSSAPLAERVTFRDGRAALPVTAYFPDFEEPEEVTAVGVLVEVPGAGVDAANPGVLREDVTSDAFVLPFDLNGDGLIDGEGRNGDYLALPVVVRFRIHLQGEHPYELSVPTWLRGTR